MWVLHFLNLSTVFAISEYASFSPLELNMFKTWSFISDWRQLWNQPVVLYVTEWKQIDQLQIVIFTELENSSILVSTGNMCLNDVVANRCIVKMYTLCIYKLHQLVNYIVTSFYSAFNSFLIKNKNILSTRKWPIT